MTNQMALWIALGSALLAVVYGLLTTTWVLGKPAGNERMQSIAASMMGTPSVVLWWGLAISLPTWLRLLWRNNPPRPTTPSLFMEPRD